jgi:hypothetical protein
MGSATAWRAIGWSEVQRTETFIESEIIEFFTKVQRTVTKDMEMC